MVIFPFRNKNVCRVTKIYALKDDRYKSGKHNGIDLVSDGSRDVLAISGGSVIRNGYLPSSWGKYIVIRHKDGKAAVYAHLSESKVKLNQYVVEGENIGVMGSTGNNTGAHLHIEIQNKYYTPSDTSEIAEYLGIKNKEGKVENVLQTELVKIKTLKGQEFAIEGINIEGSNYVKLRPVLEALGFKVGWENKTVIIEE